MAPLSSFAIGLLAWAYYSSQKDDKLLRAYLNSSSNGDNHTRNGLFHRFAVKNEPFWTPKGNFVIQMSKIKFPRQHPRSIVQRRHDHPTSLFISIPKRMVKEWDLQPGQIVEFSTLVEGQDTFLKVKKVV